MSLLLAGTVGVLAACGVWLVLRSRTFPVVLGIMLLGYAANLLVLAMGRVSGTRPPVLVGGEGGHADPVPQALVLTAIVIGFGMTAFTAVLAIRARVESGTDHVDGLQDMVADGDDSREGT
ncbi:MAG: Na+/H+ antiporter subunit C [Gemmatimonadaceae bacterium]|nr:Na+/H+ antiporter subunit C [Gemmatimonadaceae bacterium]